MTTTSQHPRASSPATIASSSSSSSGGGGGTVKPFILVPLYIYPTPETWAPLYRAADAQPDLDFYVVVNPANGPGLGALPDANYVDALARLTALGNVRVIGYVHCSYGRRPVEDIVADVEAYARWEGEMGKVAEDGKTIVVDGIFIDETPSSTEFVEYLAALANAGRTILNRNVLVPKMVTTATAGAEGGEAVAAEATAEGGGDGDSAVPAVTTNADDSGATLQPPSSFPANGGAITPSASSAVVIYNPGVVVDPIFYQAADYIVAFENAAQQWVNPVVRQGFARLPRALVRRSVAVAHSSAPGEVVQLSRRAAEAGCAGQFVTSTPGYTAWCSHWDEFVGEMAGRAPV